MKKFKKYFRLLTGSAANYALKHSKYLREETNEKINTMIADLNGCSDRWFLTPKSPLDDCVPADGDDDAGHNFIS